MENGILYTFSTIAQALGGAFALLSAFVLFRFQTLDATMWKDSRSARAGLTAGGGDVFGYDTLRAEGNYAEVIREIDAVVARQAIRSNPLFDLEVTVALY